MVFMSKKTGTENMMGIKKRSIIGARVGALQDFRRILGIGGGFIIAPILMWMGYKTKKAAATSAFAVTFSSFSGYLGHMAEGHFNWTLTIIVVIAVAIGSQLGGSFMSGKAKPNMGKKFICNCFICDSH